MLNTTYFRPNNLREALAALEEKEYDNAVLAGGTDLLVALRNYDQSTKRLVDISRIQDLKVVSIADSRVTLGAGVTFREVMENALLQQHAPLLVSACSQVGSPQVRNVGTIGGNVANAAVCADSVPALACLDGVIHLQKENSKREMKIEEFILGRNKTQIGQGELLTQIDCCMQKPNERWCFLKLGRRNALAISRFTVAIRGELDNNGFIQTACISLGAVTAQIERWMQVEETMIGESPNAALFRQCGQMVAKQMIEKYGRRWSTEYKEVAVSNLVERALGQAFFSTKQ